MAWRVKVGAARPVDVATKDAVDSVVEDTRSRYQTGARSLRVVRVYGPDGGVRVVDFEREAKDAERGLHDVERATVQGTARSVRRQRRGRQRWRGRSSNAPWPG